MEAEPERQLADPPATWQEHWFDHRQLLRLYHSDEHCAIYVDPDVRRAAVTALSRRPAREYDDALVAGLRYPWPAVADHAAEALVALDLRDAVPKLIVQLDARDRDEPYAVEAGKKKMPVVP